MSEQAKPARLVELAGRFPNARIKFYSNVLYCTSQRTFEGNLMTGMSALSMITGLSVDDLSRDEQLTVEAYTEHG